MRPLISYDDITLPYQAESKPPPNKKRKCSNQKSKQSAAQRHRTSDSHHLTGVSSLDVEIEGQELTHEDIWDDSALIAAWNAATEEYEAYNGLEKGWKTEPVHKSPLWYNAPTKQISETNCPEDKIPTAPMSNHDQGSNDQEDSTPLDFDTFVPSHNPSLHVPLPPHPASAPRQNYASHFPPEPPGHIVDEDEAFTRAIGAMYWGGYWTAVYHCQKSFAHNRLTNQENAEQDGDCDNEIVEEASDVEVEDVET